jgi:hypothetical protein
MGQHCCCGPEVDSCCRCAAQPVFWSVPWSTTTNPVGPITAAANGDYVLELVNCSNNPSPQSYTLHTRWEGVDGFTYSGGSLFHPWFVLTCGRPTAAEDDEIRKYRLVAYGYNSLFDSFQVIGSYRVNIAEPPTAGQCLGPVTLSRDGDSLGFGFPATLQMEGV